MRNILTWHTLVDVSQSFIRRRFSVAAVWRGTMIIYAGIGFNNLWKHTLIYVPGREVGLAEVACLIGIIQLEV
jgi:hypothetical protein